MSIKVDPKKKRINNSSQVRIGNDYIKKVLKEKKKTGVPVGKWIEGAIDIRIETEKKEKVYKAMSSPADGNIDTPAKNLWLDK